MGKGYGFENSLQHALQELYPSAYVHRFIQSLGSNQDFDLAVIKQQDPFFIECKNRNVKGAKTKTLDTLFDDPKPSKGKKGQLERQLQIVDRTGLRGFLAFEMSRGPGISKTAVLIDLHKVEGYRMDLHDPQIGTELNREGEEYILEKEDFELSVAG